MEMGRARRTKVLVCHEGLSLRARRRRSGRPGPGRPRPRHVFVAAHTQGQAPAAEVPEVPLAEQVITQKPQQAVPAADLRRQP